MLVRFRPFSLDTDAREVRRGDELVHLAPKAFALLEILVAGRGKAFAKAELFARLWPDTFVVEASLASLVADLRLALGDSPREPRFLRTVHGFGYAFCAEVTADSPRRREAFGAPVSHRLTWLEGEAILRGGDNLLGRDPASRVVFDHPSVSRRHASIAVDAGGRARLEDLGSRNGTYLGGKRLTAPRDLTDGDAIRLGSVDLTYRRLSAPGSTQAMVSE
jgi:DNA-binding winged helix-turn-helix (wHTH) protein